MKVAKISTRRVRWPLSALVAELTLALPHLLALVVGPLTECNHCVSIYVSMMPLLPGAWLGIVCANDVPSVAFFAFAVVGQTLVVFLLAKFLQLMDHAWRVIALMAAMGAAVHGLVLAALLRA